jgi:hypothetical protein
MICKTSRVGLFTSLAVVTAILIGSSVAPFANAQRSRRYNNDVHLKIALRHLQEARQHTEFKSRASGGHRERATRYIEQAIRELQAAERYDRSHR